MSPYIGLNVSPEYGSSDLSVPFSQDALIIPPTEVLTKLAVLIAKMIVRNV
jgi:hypothetical protein